jgi:Zn2+/Cd2+-exporting ATPase
MKEGNTIIMKKYEFEIVDLDCADCANKIQVELSKIEGMHNVSVNFAKQKLSYETDSVKREEVEKIVKSLEPEVELISFEDKVKDLKNEKAQNENKSKFLLHILRLVIGIIIAGIGLYVPMPEVVSTILVIAAYVILLYRTTKNAIKLLLKSKTINENLLITVSCIGAYLVGKHSEGLMVIALYEIGKILEEKAINKTRKSIADLMDIKPEYANLKEEKEIKVVSPAEVNIGDTVIVKQGEKIPLDGIVIKGTASLNTASLTGESKPQDVKEDTKVLSGSIVLEGLLEIKVTEKYENSTVSKILELVENATDKKAKTETFVNKAAKIYTPIVLGIAALVAIFLPLVSNVPYGTDNGSIYRALIFLVISCPCAIAISVPLCYFSGIGKSSKEGILIKGSDYLDGLKDIKEIVFDKTGTLTKGEFIVDRVDVYDESYTKEQISEYAVLGESFSNHPIAKSIVKNLNIKADKSRVSNYEEIAGKGIKYELDGKQVLVGNSNLVGKEAETADSTKIYVRVDDKLVGGIYLKDEIKEGTKEAIAKLNKKGIVTKMFTGDNKDVAANIANELEIKEYNAEMLPNDKYAKLQEEIKKYKMANGKVAFVGDGINDSPVLAVSDIGISMGGVGSQVAIEASDVVIMTDAIDKINDAIDISKRTSKIIKQNLTFSIGVKILVLILSVFGVANMWEAVFADVGATLITVLNSIRILK